MKENLKPCPFCGGEATIIESCEGNDYLDEIWVIGCCECQAEMRGVRAESLPPEYGKDEKEDLIKAWSKRIWK